MFRLFFLPPHWWYFVVSFVLVQAYVIKNNWFQRASRERYTQAVFPGIPLMNQILSRGRTRCDRSSHSPQVLLPPSLIQLPTVTQETISIHQGQLRHQQFRLLRYWQASDASAELCLILGYPKKQRGTEFNQISALAESEAASPSLVN